VQRNALLVHLEKIAPKRVACAVMGRLVTTLLENVQWDVKKDTKNLFVQFVKMVTMVKTVP